MTNPSPKNRWLTAASALLGLGVGTLGFAQSPITMDGSTGAGSGINQDFSGVAGSHQTIVIDGGGANSNGTINGNNLFFSFKQFGISFGDTALFQCTSCGVLNNVISRVTGLEPSTIDGKLQSTIANANFWFFNPKGIIFGAGFFV